MRLALVVLAVGIATPAMVARPLNAARDDFEIIIPRSSSSGEQSAVSQSAPTYSQNPQLPSEINTARKDPRSGSVIGTIRPPPRPRRSSRGGTLSRPRFLPTISENDVTQPPSETNVAQQEPESDSQSDATGSPARSHRLSRGGALNQRRRLPTISEDDDTQLPSKANAAQQEPGSNSASGTSGPPARSLRSSRSGVLKRPPSLSTISENDDTQPPSETNVAQQKPESDSQSDTTGSPARSHRLSRGGALNQRRRLPTISENDVTQPPSKTNAVQQELGSDSASGTSGPPARSLRSSRSGVLKRPPSLSTISEDDDTQPPSEINVAQQEPGIDSQSDTTGSPARSRRWSRIGALSQAPYLSTITEDDETQLDPQPEPEPSSASDGATSSPNLHAPQQPQPQTTQGGAVAASNRGFRLSMAGRPIPLSVAPMMQ